MEIDFPKCYQAMETGDGDCPANRGLVRQSVDRYVKAYDRQFKEIRGREQAFREGDMRILRNSIMVEVEEMIDRKAGEMEEQHENHVHSMVAHRDRLDAELAALRQEKKDHAFSTQEAFDVVTGKMRRYGEALKKIDTMAMDVDPFMWGMRLKRVAADALAGGSDQEPPRKKRPTIAELEAILAGGEVDIEILPSGGQDGVDALKAELAQKKGLEDRLGDLQQHRDDAAAQLAFKQELLNTRNVDLSAACAERDENGKA